MREASIHAKQSRQRGISAMDVKKVSTVNHPGFGIECLPFLNRSGMTEEANGMDSDGVYES